MRINVKENLILFVLRQMFTASLCIDSVQFSSVQLLTRVRLFASP